MITEQQRSARTSEAYSNHIPDAAKGAMPLDKGQSQEYEIAQNVAESLYRSYNQRADRFERTPGPDAAMVQFAETLLESGVSAENIARNGADGYELYQSIAYNDDPMISDDAKARALDRVVSLYQCEGLTFGAADIDRQVLYSDNPQAENTIKNITDYWHAVVTTGYDDASDKNIASHYMSGMLNLKNMINDWVPDETERYGQIAARFAAAAAIVEKTQGATLTLSKEVSDGTRLTGDQVLYGLVDVYQASPDEAITQMDQIPDCLQEMRSLPEAFQDEVRRAGQSALDTIPHLKAEIANSAMLVPFADKIQELSQDHKYLLHDISRSVRTAQEGDDALPRDEVNARVESAFAIHAQEPRWSADTIRGMLTELRSTAKQDAATDPEIIAFLGRNQREANEVLSCVGVGQIDSEKAKKAIRLFENIKQPFDNITKEILLAGDGLSEQDSVEYYTLLEEYIGKTDKNGIPYNTPRGVRGAVKEFRRRPEMKAWFLRGNVPMALAPTLSMWRQTMLDRGVEDTPDAMYDYYRQSDELIKYQSAMNLRKCATEGVVASYLKVDDDRIDELLYAAHKEARQRKDDFRLFINIDPEPLKKVVESGGVVKSIMDADVVDRNKIGGAFGARNASYIYHRADIEAVMGIRSHGENTNPVYASCGYVDHGTPGGAVGYGEIMLSFKPDAGNLRERTTYTPMDSFRSIDRLTEEDAAALRIIKSGAGMNHFRTTDYVEAQIAGGVRLNDIEEIFVPENLVEEVAQTLPPELASKIRVTQSTKTDLLTRDLQYDYTAERNLVEQYRKPAEPQLLVGNILPDIGGIDY